MSNMQSDPLLNGITNKCHLLSATKDKVVNNQLNSNDISSSKSDEQLTEPQHISIQSSFNSLLTARKDDSSWIPTILLPIIVPLCIRHDMQTLDLNSTHTDIVPFLKEPSLIMKCLYDQTLKYPKDCTIQLTGYKGIEDLERLKHDVITAAAKNGTELVVQFNDTYKNRGNK